MMAFDRQAVLRHGRTLVGVTIAYNILEGVLAITEGALSNSVALTGFGLDSLIEVSSAVVVGWRLHSELVGGQPQSAERSERRAAVIAGALLCLLALMLLADSAWRLAGAGAEPSPSIVGLVLTALSMLVMPFLARAKLRVAAQLDSRALRADAFETIACVWLSVATFIGLGLNAWLGWAWADPIAALLLVPMIAREGLEALRGDECCGHD